MARDQRARVLGAGGALEHRLGEVAGLGREPDQRPEEQRPERALAEAHSSSARHDGRRDQPADEALDVLTGEMWARNLCPPEPSARRGTRRCRATRRRARAGSAARRGRRRASRRAARRPAGRPRAGHDEQHERRAGPRTAPRRPSPIQACRPSRGSVRSERAPRPRRRMPMADEERRGTAVRSANAPHAGDDRRAPRRCPASGIVGVAGRRAAGGTSPTPPSAATTTTSRREPRQPAEQTTTTTAARGRARARARACAARPRPG